MTEHEKSERQLMAERMEKFMECMTPERVAARKRTSARCGHVKRRLLKGERLTGDLLEFAIGYIGINEIVEKLKAGEKLSDYELHLVIDVFLLHAPLA